MNIEMMEEMLMAMCIAALIYTASVIIYLYQKSKRLKNIESMVREVPCRRCGSTGGMTFDDDEKAYICDGCGERMDGRVRTETTEGRKQL